MSAYHAFEKVSEWNISINAIALKKRVLLGISSKVPELLEKHDRHQFPPIGGYPPSIDP